MNLKKPTKWLSQFMRRRPFVTLIFLTPICLYDLVFNQGARTTTPWINVVCGGFEFITDWKAFT